MRQTLALSFAATIAFSHAALALSCAAPDSMKTLAEINLSPKSYTVWHGALGVSGPVDSNGHVTLTLRGDDLTDPPGGRGAVNATFVGRVKCRGEVCGAPVASPNTLVFVELIDRKAYVDLTPCPHYVFTDIPSADLEAVRSELVGIMGYDEG